MTQNIYLHQNDGWINKLITLLLYSFRGVEVKQDKFNSAEGGG